MALVRVAAACGQYGASSSLWEADNSDFCQVELASSLGPFGALRQVWEVPSEALGHGLEVDRGNGRNRDG